MDCGFRVDLFVAAAVVVEIKAVERLAPVLAQELKAHHEIGRASCRERVYSSV